MTYEDVALLDITNCIKCSDSRVWHVYKIKYTEEHSETELDVSDILRKLRGELDSYFKHVSNLLKKPLKHFLRQTTHFH